MKLRLFSWEGKGRRQKAMQDTILPVTLFLQMVWPLEGFYSVVTPIGILVCIVHFLTLLLPSKDLRIPFHHMMGSVVFFLWKNVTHQALVLAAYRIRKRCTYIRRS